MNTNAKKKISQNVGSLGHSEFRGRKKNTHTPKLAKMLAASAIQNLEAEKKTHTPKLAKTLAASAIQNLEAEKKHTHTSKVKSGKLP